LYLETGQANLESHVVAAAECARRLEEVEPNATGLLLLRSSIHRRRGELREAIGLLERIRSREPNSPDALGNLAYLYFLSGEDDRGLAAAQEAIAVDPLTPLLRCMPGFYELVQGRAAAGVPHYRKTLAMDPTNPVAHFFLLIMLAHAGETGEAIALGERLGHEYASTVFGAMGFAFARALAGDLAAANAALTPELRAASKQSEMFGRFLADLFSISNQPEAALDALEDAVSLGLAHYPFLARHDRLLDPIRGEPRFERLLEVVRGRWDRGGTSAADLSEVS
jgi:tetratricopeptide (TPR) repeat protein